MVFSSNRSLSTACRLEGRQRALPSPVVALAPVGPDQLLMVVRQLNIAFYSGELARLSAFADGIAGIARLRDGVQPVSPTFAIETSLPERAITVAGSVAVG